MKNFDGRVAAITGAGSGIGRALAEELASCGASLALSDIDEVGLAETVGLVEDRGVKVTSSRLDVADRGAVFAWADDVVADHGSVNLIFNNAGVAVVAPVEAISYDDFEWLMNINFWGVVHGTKAFLPHLKKAGEGHVVNISSVFGLMAIPGQSAYNAAKFAVRGFTDALRIELDIERCGVSATTVHPGGIRTNIVRRARVGDSREEMTEEERAADFEKIARTTPASAAKQILAAVAKNRRRTLIGPDAVLFDFISRLPASISQNLLAFAARRRLSWANDRTWQRRPCLSLSLPTFRLRSRIGDGSSFKARQRQRRRRGKGERRKIDCQKSTPLVLKKYEIQCEI